MAMDSPTETIIAAVGALLATSGPTFVGAEYLGDNDSPPRYVWVPIEDTPLMDEYVGGEPPALACINATFGVHCWGATYAHAWRLRQALITALDETVIRSLSIGSAKWTPGSVGVQGYLVVQTVSLFVPIVEAAYPAALGDDIVNASHPIVQATKADFDTSGEVDGDGILVSPNK